MPVQRPPRPRELAFDDSPRTLATLTRACIGSLTYCDATIGNEKAYLRFVTALRNESPNGGTPVISRRTIRLAYSRRARRSERCSTGKDGNVWKTSGKISKAPPRSLPYLQERGHQRRKELSKSFGDKWTAFEGAPEKTVLSNDDIAAFAEANPDIGAISSHKARPFPSFRTFFPILFLRHPIDRARSMYYFAKRDPVQIDHPVARDSSFQDYVNYWINSPSSILRNYQVAHLSQASFRVPDLWHAAPRPEDLLEACDYLGSLRFFGLVRRFEASCRGFEASYRRTFPALRMCPVRENASTEKSLSETAMLNVARHELGAAAYMRLIDANQFDLALYDTALKLFDRNLARISERSLHRAGRVVIDLVHRTTACGRQRRG